jgi:hypothetical protein
MYFECEKLEDTNWAIGEGQTIQWLNEKVQKPKDKQWYTKHHAEN